MLHLQFDGKKSYLHRELCTDEDVQTESKYGSIQFRLPGSPFSPTCGKDSAYFGKIFTLKLVEEMHVIGFDFMACADLSRAFDQGSLMFKQSLMSGQRPRKSIIAIAPYGNDKLHLVNCTDGVVQTVMDVIVSVWKFGVKSEGASSSEKQLYEIKLKGNRKFVLSSCFLS